MIDAMVSLDARRSLVMAVVLLGHTACDGGGEGAVDGGITAASDGATGESCPDWASELTYGRNGLLAVGDGPVTARVLDANALPPRKGFNTWTIELASRGALDQDDGASDGGAEPSIQDEYQISWICAFMPGHPHTWGPDVAPGEEANQFEVSRINLAMYGGWEVKLWVDRTDSGVKPYDRSYTRDWCKPVGDQARVEDLVFRVCVPRL